MSRIGSVQLASRFGLAPMAGMTDTAFRRLVKRHGGCGLVVTEMVSSEGLVRGIDRTLEYAEFTEDERPASIQIFGGDPTTMASAARIVEQMGADIVDINMGCPVPKIAKHQAGCRLMREPARAAAIVGAMAKAVGIPVTVKMRAGWNEREINAPELARRVEGAGAAAVTVHGRTAAQSYSGESDWNLIGRVAAGVRIPVFGSGDCLDAEQLIRRAASAGVAGVLVGRGVLRNPWIFAQARALESTGVAPGTTPFERGRFLLDYIDLLLSERTGEPTGFRHAIHNGRGRRAAARRSTGSRQRWVINKLRALGTWYTKGVEHGSRLRIALNHADSIDELRAIVGEFFDLDQSASMAN